LAGAEVRRVAVREDEEGRGARVAPTFDELDRDVDDFDRDRCAGGVTRLVVCRAI
jgi:hypothetical protein